MTDSVLPPTGATRPPIPDRLADAHRSGDLVVPYITLTHHDRTRPVWGKVHAPAQRRVWRQKLCQICGQPLLDWVVVYLRPADYTRGIAVEPGMHPECAHYSASACPVLAGRINRYHPDPDRHLSPCGDTRCACRIWTRVTEVPPHLASQPAEAWYEGWLPLSDYTIVTDHGNDTTQPITGVDLREVQLRRLRRIRAAGPGGEQSTDPLAVIIAVRKIFGYGEDLQ